jgi:hypothetical protein
MSCLFDSLSHFIPHSDPHTVRQRICDYLQENYPIIDGMTTRDVLQLESVGSSDQYIGAMRSPPAWGGAIEIQAACNIWSTRIMVRDVRSGHGQTIEFLPIANVENAGDFTSFELEWSGGHYEPKRP